MEAGLSDRRQARSEVDGIAEEGVRDGIGPVEPLISATNVPVSSAPVATAPPYDDGSLVEDPAKRAPLVLGNRSFGEVTDMWTWIGAGIIFAATWYMTWAESRAARQR